MKKTVKYNGQNIKVEFEEKINSRWYAKEQKEGQLNALINYDYIINGRVFKVVAECVGYRKRGINLYAGSIENSVLLSVPEHLKGTFRNTQKCVIEALLIKYPELKNKKNEKLY